MSAIDLAYEIYQDLIKLRSDQNETLFKCIQATHQLQKSSYEKTAFAIEK